jgi:hypothetical protein
MGSSVMTDLRTPKAPCTVRDLEEAFVVIDGAGQSVAYCTTNALLRITPLRFSI